MLKIYFLVKGIEGGIGGLGSQECIIIYGGHPGLLQKKSTWAMSILVRVTDLGSIEMGRGDPLHSTTNKREKQNGTFKQW